jgi:methionine aminopeptidase
MRYKCWSASCRCSDINVGYHGDVNATYAVGDIDEASKKLIRTTRQCLDEAIKMCKPGALIRDIGKVMWVQYFCTPNSELNAFHN